MTTSSIPASSASSTMSRMAGLAMPSRSTIGNSSFLVALLAGNRRVPKPAAGMSALRTFGPVPSVRVRPGRPRSRSRISTTACWSAALRRDELRGAVALRADALAAPDVRPQRLVREHAVQHRRGQLLGAGGSGVAVEERLRLGHQRAEPLGVARLERRPGLAHDPLVDRPEQLLHAALERPFGERGRSGSAA